MREGRKKERGRPGDGGTEDPPVRIPIEDVIDLHAFRPEEVGALVADYVEEAAGAGLRFVRIVHGRGGGVLRNTVRAALARHPLVEDYRDAPPEAGGFGATLAVLRAPGRPTSAS